MTAYDMDAKEAQAKNEVIMAGLRTQDAGLKKKANDMLNDFVRLRLREGGLARKIIEPEKKGPSDIDRQATTEKPTFVIDLEAESPAAISIGFGDKPDQYYIKGDRFTMMADRIVTNRFWKDVGEMMSWKMDIRTVVSDNSVKDMMAEEDLKLFSAVNTLLGTINSVRPTSGKVQYQGYPSSISRDSFVESCKLLRSTPSAFSPAKIVMNHLTILDFVKWGRIEWGGDISEQLMRRRGLAELNSELIGTPVITTIKTDIVENNDIYFFAEDKCFGRFYVLEDITMYTKAETWIIEFMASSLIAMGIANANAVAKARFNA